MIMSIKQKEIKIEPQDRVYLFLKLLCCQTFNKVIQGGMVVLS